MIVYSGDWVEAAPQYGLFVTGKAAAFKFKNGVYMACVENEFGMYWYPVTDLRVLDRAIGTSSATEY